MTQGEIYRRTKGWLLFLLMSFMNRESHWCRVHLEWLTLYIDWTQSYIILSSGGHVPLALSWTINPQALIVTSNILIEHKLIDFKKSVAYHENVQMRMTNVCDDDACLISQTFRTSRSTYKNTNEHLLSRFFISLLVLVTWMFDMKVQMWKEHELIPTNFRSNWKVTTIILE